MNKKPVSKVMLFCGIVMALILITFLYAYLNVKYNFGMPCAINKIFGIYCSGCGLTRAVGSMLELDFYQAFRYNAFSLILIPTLVFAIICFIWECIFCRETLVVKIPVWLWISLFIAFLGYGIARNFIVYLQPTEL